MPLETQTNQVSRCMNQVSRTCLLTAKEIQIVSIRSSWLTRFRNHGSRSVLEIQLRFRKRLAPECLLNFNDATIYALMNLKFINQWVSRNVAGAPNFLLQLFFFLCSSLDQNLPTIASFGVKNVDWLIC